MHLLPPAALSHTNRFAGTRRPSAPQPKFGAFHVFLNGLNDFDHARQIAERIKADPAKADEIIADDIATNNRPLSRLVQCYAQAMDYLIGEARQQFLAAVEKNLSVETLLTSIKRIS